MRQTFFHSPFSPEIVKEGSNPALLLQFILKELIEANNHLVETQTSFSSPFDWKYPAGSFNKVQEHAELLAHAFPELEKEALHFKERLHEPCDLLISYLEPFILASRETVYLIYFLTKHRSHEAISRLLLKIPKENMEKMQSVVATKYRKKRLSPPSWIY